MSNFVPTYALYGEYLEEAQDDVLHFEPLRERSAKHDWSIEPHKHDTLWQIFRLKSEGVRMLLDGQTTLTIGPVFVSIPPLFVHAFHFPKNALGGVVSVRLPVITNLLQTVPDSEALPQRVWVVDEESPEFAALERSNANIEDGFKHVDRLRNAALATNLTAMLISMTRHSQSKRQLDGLVLPDKTSKLLREFCNLIEVKFKTKWILADYASELGISTVSLNRKCRQTLGSSPQKLLTRRRVLEAKRMLQFTQLSVTEISNQLGFGDPSYFCRLFKKQTNDSPAKFRRNIS